MKRQKGHNYGMTPKAKQQKAEHLVMHTRLGNASIAFFCKLTMVEVDQIRRRLGRRANVG